MSLPPFSEGRKEYSMKKVILCILLTFFTLNLSIVVAQTPQFYKNTVSGAYIYKMLDYARYEEMECDLNIPDYVDDYLCVQDTDSVPFDLDVSSYTRIWSDDIISGPDWVTADNGVKYASLIFTDGYTLELFVLEGVVALLGR